MIVPRRKLGRTGAEVSVIGLGGLFQNVEQRQVCETVEAALGLGVNVFELGPAYGDSVEKLGPALSPHRKGLFLAAKCHARSREGARAELDRTLTACGTDHVDLLSLHDISSLPERNAVMGPGGSYETLLKAQRNGETHWLGLTAHDQSVLLWAVEDGGFDVVLLAYNLADKGAWWLLPEARRRGVGIMAMKPLGAGQLVREGFTVQQCLDFVLEPPEIACALVGCACPEQARIAAEASRHLGPSQIDFRFKFMCDTCFVACETACPKKILIRRILRLADVSRRYYWTLRDCGDAYDWELNVARDCLPDCDRCEKVCPIDLPVKERLRAAEERLRDARRKCIVL